MPGGGNDEFQKEIPLFQKSEVLHLVRDERSQHQDGHSALFHLVRNAGHQLGESRRDLPVDRAQGVTRLIGPQVAPGRLLGKPPALQAGAVDLILKVQDFVGYIRDLRADHGPEGTGDIQLHCKYGEGICERDIPDPYVIGAGVDTANAGAQFFLFINTEGDLLPVFDLIEMTPIVPGAKTHPVDRERSCVLYFGKVFVVLAAHDPVDFNLLVKAQEVIIQEDIQRGERKQQQACVQPCEGYRAAVETGERDAGSQAEEVYGSACGVDAEIHRGTFACARILAIMSPPVTRLSLAPEERTSRWGSVRVAAEAISSGMQ